MNKHLTALPAALALAATTVFAAPPTFAAERAAAKAAAAPKASYVCLMANHVHMEGMTPVEYDRPGICPDDGSELIAKNSRLRVAVLVFDGVQDIDYGGPMEVFGQSGATIFTVAAGRAPIHSVYGITITPDFDIDNAPEADVLIVPGGNVSAVTRNPKVMDWLRRRSGEVRTVLSVCTGAFIAGQAGLLDGATSTTIAGATGLLAKMFPKTQVVVDRRYTDDGHIVTTAGLSAGIDGALHVIERELGPQRAADIARGIEYEWHRDGKGGFGLLAGNQMPDLSTILPAGTPWERQFESGDKKKWEIRGNLELAQSSQAFLDASAATINTESWTTLPGPSKSSRRFTRNKDGHVWLLTLALAAEATHDHYRLTYTVAQIPPGKAK